ncbi:uncharacterized protein ARMOST_21697 [Armillaria ostoyae]|uniref:Uncharacterized protein n=1 Tax=Armillaria ostoyae TaxID=47428 RepID=A0A284SAX8_ARMOS|nr:uncharacterized protein ARMOST_21697 [Armillaria ostoyae]
MGEMNNFRIVMVTGAPPR